jgi:hypothetical protein
MLGRWSSNDRASVQHVDEALSRDGTRAVLDRVELGCDLSTVGRLNREVADRVDVLALALWNFLLFSAKDLVANCPQRYYWRFLPSHLNV